MRCVVVNVKAKIGLFVINILISIVIVVLQDHSNMIAAIAIIYNIVLLMGIIKKNNRKNNFFSKLIGPWSLIYFLTITIVLPYKYVMYDKKPGLTNFGTDEIIVFVVSMIGAILLVLLINDYLPELNEKTVENIIMVCFIKILFIYVSISFFTGQILLFNDLKQFDDSIFVEYTVVDKDINELYYTDYYLTLEATNSNQLYLDVSHETFKQTLVGDTMYLEVFRGLFGIEYLNN